MNKATLLILAAGMGSRYKGQKQIDSVSDQNESLMEFTIYDALQSGIRKFVLIVNSQFPIDFKNKLIQISENQNFEIHFVEQTIEKFIPKEFKFKLNQRNKPLGTAHAVYCAKDIIHEPFITVNADDFYGRESFKMAMKSIESNEISDAQFGMVAFELNNTLSENGTVSRGICSVKNQFLESVEEFTSISKSNQNIQGLSEINECKKLNSNDLVSMNLWILNPSYFEYTQKDLIEFLAQEDLSKSEFYLPSVINKALHEQNLKVKVLASTEKWFGLTYREDKEMVLEAIASRKANEIYPENLWNLASIEVK